MWGHGGLYADWARFLEAWAADQRPLPARPAALSSDDFDPDTWTRLMIRVQQAINDRLQRWSTNLSRHLGGSADEFSWGRALSQSRDGLRAIREFCALQEFPPEVRDTLSRQVAGIITTQQQTLEEDAARQLTSGQHRSGEIQLRQLRANPLTAVLTESATSAAALPPSLGGPGAEWSGARHGSRRQILIDPREGS